MESGTVVRWLKAEGDSVKKREPLYELDTDKVTQEVEAENDGVLLKILIDEGEVAVGTTIAYIGTEGEVVEVSAEAPKTAAAPSPSPRRGRAEGAAPSEPARDNSTQAPSTTTGAANGRVKASPLARRIARERGIDLARVTGTGPDGRIVAADVEAAGDGGPAAPVAMPPAEVEVVQLTSIRKTIARRLTEAWEAPVFQLGVRADMTELLALRERLVERLAEGDVKPTVNDVLVKLVAVALTRHTAVNAQFTGTEIHRFAAANVGLAVAAPAGLVVPVDQERRPVDDPGDRPRPCRPGHSCA